MKTQIEWTTLHFHWRHSQNVWQLLKFVLKSSKVSEMKIFMLTVQRVSQMKFYFYWNPWSIHNHFIKILTLDCNHASLSITEIIQVTVKMVKRKLMHLNWNWIGPGLKISIKLGIPFFIFRLLDARHDKHEAIFKQSRDITVDSKRLIFAIHRLFE